MSCRKPTAPAAAAAVLVATAFSCAAASLAQGQDDDDQDIFELSPFTIDMSGEKGYRVANSFSGTRIAKPIQEIPLPISVLTQDLLEDTFADASFDIKEAARYAPGVQIDGDIGTVNIRGWRAAEYFQDGQPAAAEQYQANIQRVEVLKGPSSLLFGRANPGGLVNLVSKKAYVSEAPRTTVSLSAGSWGRFVGEVDTNFSLVQSDDFDAALRLIGAADHWDEMRGLDQEKQDIESVNAMLHVRAGDRFWFDIAYDFNDATVDPFAGRQMRVVQPATPRTIEEIRESGAIQGEHVRFLIEDFGRGVNLRGITPFNERQIGHNNWRTEFEYEVSEAFTLHGQFNYYDWFWHSAFAANRGGLFPGGAELSAEGDIVAFFGGLDSDFGRHHSESLARLEGLVEFRTGGIEHELVIGYDWQDRESDAQAFNQRDTDAAPRQFPGNVFINLTEQYPTKDNPNSWPIAWADPASRLGCCGTNIRDIWGAYLVDYMTAMEGKMRVIFGLRYDDISERSTNANDGEGPWRFTPGEGFRQLPVEETGTPLHTTATSPQVAVSYDFAEGLTGYAMYSESITPNTVTQQDEQGLPPQTGEGIEVGLKLSLWDDKVSGTLSYYDIDRTNIPHVDEAASDRDAVPPLIVWALSGLENTQGIDLDLAFAPVEDWQVLFGFNTFDSEIVSNETLPALEGKPFDHIADTTVKLWTKYRFGETGFALFGGFTHVADRPVFRGGDTQVDTLPSYERVDLGFSYDFEFGEEIDATFTLNVQNATDETYLEHHIGWGQARSYFGTMRFRF